MSNGGNKNPSVLLLRPHAQRKGGGAHQHSAGEISPYNIGGHSPAALELTCVAFATLFHVWLRVAIRLQGFQFKTLNVVAEQSLALAINRPISSIHVSLYVKSSFQPVNESHLAWLQHRDRSHGITRVALIRLVFSRSYNFTGFHNLSAAV